MWGQGYTTSARHPEYNEKHAEYGLSLRTEPHTSRHPSGRFYVVLADVLKERSTRIQAGEPGRWSSR